MKKMLFPIILTIFLLAGCTSVTNQPGSTNTSQENPDNQEAEELANNLDVPWSIQKHDDIFYISEHPGSIIQIDGESSQRQNVSLNEDLSDNSEAGLLGFVLDPDFAQNNEAFAYYTYENNEGIFNKIVKLQMDNDEWEETETLLDDIPGGDYHDGGRLAIGPDDHLYATTGDAYDLDGAQNLDTLNGKILRLNFDGSVPSDNPDEDSYVFSYGHRNSQGMSWDSTDTMYASEHGDSANDEINQIEAGNNYGWPLIEGTEEDDGMETPLFTSGNDETWAPSGMDIWQDHLYVGALRGSAILEINLENQEIQTFVDDYGRIRDVFIEDDDLFFVTNNLDGRGEGSSDDDKLYRVNLNEE